MLSEWVENSARPVAFQAAPDIRAYVGSDIGLVRRENQDRSLLARLNYSSEWEETLTFAILCDGVGGLAAGGRCAEIALTEVLFQIVFGKRADSLYHILKQAIDQANKVVSEAFKGRGGTTLAIVLASEHSYYAATVGDSRIYVYDGGVLKQVSTDDTIAGELARLSGRQLESSQLGPASQHLAQYVGMGMGIEPRIYDLQVTSRTRSILLTSDGAHSIGLRDLAGLYENAHNGEFTKRVLALAKWLGGQDNASIIQLNLEGVVKNPITPSGAQTLELWSGDQVLSLLLDYDPQLSSMQDQQKSKRTRALKREQAGGSGSATPEKPERQISLDDINSEDGRRSRRKPSPQQRLEIAITDVPISPEKVTVDSTQEGLSSNSANESAVTKPVPEG